MKNPYTYDPKTDAPILKAKMQEFLETLDDEEKDERYATPREFAAGALERFYNFINKQ